MELDGKRNNLEIERRIDSFAAYKLMVPEQHREFIYIYDLSNRIQNKGPQEGIAILAMQRDVDLFLM
jgi:hypothetical protein